MGCDLISSCLGEAPNLKEARGIFQISERKCFQKNKWIRLVSAKATQQNFSCVSEKRSPRYRRDFALWATELKLWLDSIRTPGMEHNPERTASWMCAICHTTKNYPQSLALLSGLNTLHPWRFVELSTFGAKTALSVAYELGLGLPEQGGYRKDCTCRWWCCRWVQWSLVDTGTRTHSRNLRWNRRTSHREQLLKKTQPTCISANWQAAVFVLSHSFLAQLQCVFAGSVVRWHVPKENNFEDLNTKNTEHMFQKLSLEKILALRQIFCFCGSCT